MFSSFIVNSSRIVYRSSVGSKNDSCYRRMAFMLDVGVYKQWNIINIFIYFMHKMNLK